MILHVSPAHHGLDLGVLELGEELVGALAEDVDEDVEAPAVGHAHDDLLAALPREFLEQPVEQRDQALGAFQREPLLADVLAVEERLQRLGLGEPRQDAQLLLAGQRRRVLRGLHALLQPALDGGILAVHVLDADGAAVGPAQAGEDLAQRHLALAAGEVAGREGLVEIRVGEAEMLDLQLRRRRLEEPERVQIGEEVAADAVRVDQLGDLLLEDLGVKAILHLGNRNDVEAEVRRSRKGKIPVPVSVSRRRSDWLRPGAGLEGRRGRQPVEAGEVLLPLGGDGGGVVAPPLVLILDEDLVDSEIAVEVHGAREDNRAPR